MVRNTWAIAWLVFRHEFSKMCLRIAAYVTAAVAFVILAKLFA